jgi:hypothetical protein
MIQFCQFFLSCLFINMISLLWFLSYSRSIWIFIFLTVLNSRSRSRSMSMRMTLPVPASAIVYIHIHVNVTWTWAWTLSWTLTRTNTWNGGGGSILKYVQSSSPAICWFWKKKKCWKSRCILAPQNVHHFQKLLLKNLFSLH